jgi:phosphatidylglycerol:prolipoprotein diacylglycerol transferase
VADVLAPGIILGQAVGILACLATGDSYGRPTDLAWAITYTDPRAMAPRNVALHPVEPQNVAELLLIGAALSARMPLSIGRGGLP